LGRLRASPDFIIFSLSYKVKRDPKNGAENAFFEIMKHSSFASHLTV
jgi:hypothetical protein